LLSKTKGTVSASHAVALLKTPDCGEVCGSRLGRFVTVVHFFPNLSARSLIRQAKNFPAVHHQVSPYLQQRFSRHDSGSLATGSLATGFHDKSFHASGSN
jgi:hypothetical protein